MLLGGNVSISLVNPPFVLIAGFLFVRVEKVSIDSQKIALFNTGFYSDSGY